MAGIAKCPIQTHDYEEEDEDDYYDDDDDEDYENDMNHIVFGGEGMHHVVNVLNDRKNL